MNANYFPPLAFDEDLSLHAYLAGWYRRHLQTLREDVLFDTERDGRPEVYRFLWLRTFHHPLVFRLDVEPDGAGRLTFKETSGAGGYGEGELTTERSVALAAESVSAFRARLEESSYWQMSSRDDSRGLDGSEWVLEAVHRNRYHVVGRWCGGAIREVALMLVGYSGHEVGPVY